MIKMSEYSKLFAALVQREVGSTDAFENDSRYREVVNKLRAAVTEDGRPPPNAQEVFNVIVCHELRLVCDNLDKQRARIMEIVAEIESDE